MNDQTIKRFFSAPRALRLYGVRRGAMMLLATLLLTMTAQTAWADDMNIVATGQTISDETTWQNCTVNITGNGTVYFSKRINISGAVTLNLGEGATLTDNYGIHVSEGNSLTIAGTGNLITGGTYQKNPSAGAAAGIGGNSYETCGTINITGGNITARGYSAAGIGGGGYGGSGGFINISGGNVTATGNGWSAGIGGGEGSNGVTGAAGTINISGGVVNANGSAGGAGIGGGGYSNGTGGAGGTITISGGQVTARGGNSGGSGIGTGYGASNGGSEGTITLSWTDDTDWIDASSYVGNIGFVEGKRFYYYDTADYVDANGLYKQSKKIVPAIANNSSLAFAVIQMPRSYVTTNGTAVTVSYEVYDYNSNKLTLGTDYNAIIKNSSNEEVTTFDQLGDYTLTVTGTGTYTGSKTYTFSLVEWDLELTQDGSGYYINLPENGTKTVSLNVNQSIKVYDSGGKDGALVASDGRLLLQAPDGYALEVTGKTDAMRYNTANSLWVNSLSAYEGDSFSNEIFLLQTNSDNILFTSGGNVMLMRLNVPALYTFESQYGLDLTVRVIPQQSYTITKGTVSNGSIDIADNKTTANTNEMITLTVNPAEGYLLKRITITDTDGGSTIQTIGEDQWYSGDNTISFKMPSRNVTITPEFTNSLTAEGGLSMNIDLSGTKECVIPEIVQSFHIRASAFDNPTGGSSVTIILKAHNEYCLQAAGQIDFVNTQYDDGVFSLYDGSGTSSPSALLINVEGKNKEKVSIGTQTSSSNYMTISLSEDGPYNSVFTGTIETQIKNYSITYDLVGGSVATDNPTTYNYKTDAFTLTNPTREGYTFAGWTGTGLDAASTSVTIAKGSTGVRNYTATWNIITYNITYNNAVNGTDGVTNSNPATYTIESEAITLADPSKTGYVFAGWFSDAEFNTPATTTIAANSTGDKTFWAKWKKSLENGDITIAAIADQEWTGSEIKPTALVVVKDGETVITDQCDISFSNNTNVGTATVNITAKANSTGYAGTKNDVTFKIVAKPATIAGVSGGPLSFTQDQNGYTAIFDGTSETDLNITATVAVKDVKINREFHSGQASTVMLPFDYTCNNGEGGKFYAFVGVAWNDSENKWEATMKEPGNTAVTSLTANTPYLFMPSGTEMTFPNIPNMTDGTVTLKPASEGGNCSGTSGDANWEFHGTYTKKTWTSSDSDKDYGFAATSGTATDGTTTITAGQFVRFAPGAWMKPMRCYLSYIGTSAPAPARGVTRAAGDGLPQTITVRLVSRGGETTAIGTLDTQTGELSFDGWYDMNGRKLDGKPTKKGLYINNGHKVVIK